MPKDTRVSGLQVNKLIASGSTGTGAKLLVYRIEHEDGSDPNNGVIDAASFPTSSIGTDIFLFVSGGIGDDIVALGGDLHVSGNLIVDGYADLQEIDEYLYPIGLDLVGLSGSLQVTGSGLFKSGLTGALNSLPDGSPFLLAGDNIALSTGSNGQILIDFNDASSIQFSGSAFFGSGITGALNRLPDGSAYLRAGPAILLSTGSNGAITIEALTGSVGAPGDDYQLAFNDGVSVLTASTEFHVLPGTGMFVSGAVHSPAFSGSLTTLEDGSPYIIVGPSLTVITNSNGSLTMDALPSFFYSQTAGTTEATGSLAVSGSGLFKSGLTGALNVLPDGSPSIIGQGGASISTGSNGQIVISASFGVLDHGELTGLDDDDHMQYLLIDGTRQMTGNLDMGGFSIEDLDTITGGTGSFWDLDVSNSLDINGAWTLTSETEGGTERLLLTGQGANDGSELFLQSKGSADEARITLSPDENTNNYGGLEIEARNAANSINSIAEGSGTIRPIRIGITGSAIMVVDTDGAVTFQTGSVTVEEELIGNDVHVSGTLTANDITGSITRTEAGTSFIVTSNGLSISTGSNGQINISGNPMSASIEQDITNINAALAGSSAWYNIVPGLVETTSSVGVSGSITAQSGITGALNKVVDGSDFLTGHNGITTATGSNGAVALTFNEEFFYPANRTVAGGFTLAATDNNSTIYVSSATDVNVTIPAGLQDGFQVFLVQAGEGQMRFVSTPTLNSGSGLFPTSSQQFSQVGVSISGSEAHLFGELVTAAVDADLVTFDPITNFSSSNVQDAIAEVNVISASIDQTIQDVSGALVTTITTLSGVVATDINSIEAEIANGLIWRSEVTDLAFTTGSFEATGSGLVKGALTTNDNLWVDGNANVSGNIVAAGNVTATGRGSFSSGLTGALNILPGGAPFILGNDVITAATAANGQISFGYNEPGKFTSFKNYSDTTIFLSDEDNRYVLFVSTVLDSKINIPDSLTEGFECLVVQEGIGKLEFESSGSLFYPATLTPSSSQRYSKISIIVSGSDKNAYLDGDLLAEGGVAINVLDSSGDRTLTSEDNGTVIFMSGSSANILRVPPTLRDGFNVVAIQSSAFNIQVVATNSLFYPSTTFTSRSAEENSMITLYSGSVGIHLGGDMELV